MVYGVWNVMMGDGDGDEMGDGDGRGGETCIGL